MAGPTGTAAGTGLLKASATSYSTRPASPGERLGLDMGRTHCSRAQADLGAA